MRLVRGLLWLLALLLVLLLALVGGAWWWGGSQQSLAAVLTHVAPYLPAGHSLESRDVTGSVRAGGHIGWLRWQSPTLAVEVHQLDVGWRLAPLLKRKLELGELHAALLVIEGRSAAAVTAQAPEELVLPIDIELPVRVDELRWNGPPPVTALALVGRYRYEKQQHQLDISGVTLADGHYSAQLTLQGPAPMALAATLAGKVKAPMPEGVAALTVLAQAKIDGTLSGPGARLQITAQLAPESPAVTSPDPTASASAAHAARSAATIAPPLVLAAPDPMHAALEAQLAPWAAQPVLSARAELANVNAARLWPGAPQTLLSGQVTAGPLEPAAAAPTLPSSRPAPSSLSPSPATPAPSTPPVTPSEAALWQGQIDLRNAQPGAWDQQRLPLQRLRATARFDGAHWQFPDAVLEVGGGQIAATGRWSPTPNPWQVNLKIDNVRPAALYSELDATPIDGRVKAEQKDGTLVFDLALQARARVVKAVSAVAAKAAKVAVRRRSGKAIADEVSADGKPGGLGAVSALRIDRAAAQGQWRGQALTLKALRIDAGPAHIEGRLSAQLDTLSGEAKLDLTLPGATARLDGQIGRTRGAGDVKLQVDDAAAVQRWVEALPGLSSLLAGASAQGAAQLDARWQGGWQTWRDAVMAASATNGTAAGRGDALHLQAQLTAPKFELKLPDASAARTAASTSVAAPAPAFTAAAQTATSVQLRGVRAELAGSPADATLALDGEATLGAYNVGLRTRASGAMTGRDQWRLALASLRLQAKRKNDSGAGAAAPWLVELDRPLSATVKRGAAIEIDTSAGGASLRGPVPGTVKLDWQPVRFSQSSPLAAPGSAALGSNASPRYRLRSQGKLTGLPMTWASALGALGASIGTDADSNATPDDFSQLGALGISGDLIFDGDWDIDAGDALHAQARLARRSGDLRVQLGETTLVRRIRTSGTGTPGETTIDSGAGRDGKATTGQNLLAAPTTPAGLRQAELTLSAQGDTVKAQLAWDSERAGQINAEVSTRMLQQRGAWQWPESAPLAGMVHARLPNIGVWSMLAPPGWRVQGTLDADATLGGHRAAPLWRGNLSADGVSVKALVEGIDLRDGRLRASLRDNRLEVSEFTLRGGAASSVRIAGLSGNLSTARSEAGNDGGTLTARGNLSWGDSAPSGTASGIRASIDAEASALRLLVRTDRQASVSGQLQLRLDQGQLSVRGKLKARRAVIILPDESAPTLDNDVVVHSAAKDREAARLAQIEQTRLAQAAQAQEADSAALKINTPKPPDIAVSFDLGDDFAVQGRGITTRLAGQIDIRSNATTGGKPQLLGEIRTVKGQYRAYGQQLDIETGVARFNGPYDNPALDILAIRPNISQRAGVQISGSALTPRVKLYSEPSLSDAEALSWVVLGRGQANGGAEALLMQQAALALLSGLGQKSAGSLASRFGLDEIGFKGPSNGEDVRNSAVTLGKRLSKDFYVTYERSLSGTLGTLYIFYDLTRRLTLRAQASSQSAVDLIYTFSFD